MSQIIVQFIQNPVRARKRGPDGSIIAEHIFCVVLYGKRGGLGAV